MNSRNHPSGFTIVELIITVVVIAALTIIAILSYIGMTVKAIDSSIFSDVSNMDKKQKVYLVGNDNAKEYYSGLDAEYNQDLDYRPSRGNVIDVVISGSDYCIRGYNTSGTYNNIDTAYTKESSPGICDANDPSDDAEKYSPDGGGGGGGGLASIDVGEEDTCVVRSDGTVWCWGWNMYENRLGIPTGEDFFTKDALTPIQVVGVGGVGYLTNVKTVEAGEGHTCALKNDGTVWCWGYNYEGELGDNLNVEYSRTPVQVMGAGGVGYLTSITEITIGSDAFSTCALKSDGTVWCWGYNWAGEIGSGVSDVQSNVPIQVVGLGGVGYLTDVRSISMGENTTCAAKNDGTVWCWGSNFGGELGNNTESVDSYTPIQVVGVGGTGYLQNIKSVALDLYSCALSNENTVFCWGYGSDGELGNGQNVDSYSPVQVVGVGGVGYMTNVKKIGVGQGFACALKNDGTVYCWGENYYGDGALGDGTANSSNTPVQVKDYTGSGNLVGITDFDVGFGGVASVSTGGRIYSWGDYTLGNGTFDTSLLPVAAIYQGGITDYLDGVSSVNLGSKANTCVTKSDSSLLCWGMYQSIDYIIPNEIPGPGGVGYLDDISSVDWGDDHSCAVKNDGTVWCWGVNVYGQLGNGNNTDSDTPVQVLGVGGSGYLTGVQTVTSGRRFSCALKTDGSVFCWGWGDRGRLGNNSTSNSNTPVQVLGVGGSGYLTGINNIDTFWLHTCVVSSGGSAYCWGDNANYKLGGIAGTYSATPAQVYGAGGVGNLSGVESINTMVSSSCAVLTDGTAWCWGYNGKGQLGDNTITQRNYPVQVHGVNDSGYLQDIQEISGGWHHNCALKNDGSVYCWGRNELGELGINTIDDSYTPVQVLGVGGVGVLSDITMVSSGWDFSCALNDDGYAYCWGGNEDYVLGIGWGLNQLTPTRVASEIGICEFNAVGTSLCVP